jgi:hypothetical protein
MHVREQRDVFAELAEGFDARAEQPAIVHCEHIP